MYGRASLERHSDRDAEYVAQFFLQFLLQIRVNMGNMHVHVCESLTLILAGPGTMRVNRYKNTIRV